MSDNTLNRKNIKDYLHLYLGCQCKRMGQDDDSETFRLTGISWDGTQNIWWAYFEDKEDCYSVIDDVFPILRPLSDMTEDEAKVLCSMQIKGLRTCDHVKIVQMTPVVKFVIYSDGEDPNDDHGRLRRFLNIESYLVPQFKYLLSKGFDLFGLIDAGLVIKKSQ